MNINEALDKVSEILTKVTPELADVTLEVYRLQAIQGVIELFMTFIVFLIATYITRKFYTCFLYYSDRVATHNVDSDVPAGYWWLSMGSGVVSSVLGLIFAVSLTNIHYFVGVWNPKLFAAYKLIESITK